MYHCIHCGAKLAHIRGAKFHCSGCGRDYEIRMKRKGEEKRYSVVDQTDENGGLFGNVVPYV